MADWYCGSTKYTAVAQWAASTGYVIGDLRRQLATPGLNSDRVFRCTTAGTSLASEPAWVLTKGGTTTESGGPVWLEVTGNSTYGWAAAHARLAAALAWAGSFDNIYVSHAHAETRSTSININVTGGVGSFTYIRCVNDGAFPPTTLATTATVSVTGASTIAVSGNGRHSYFYGINFVGGSATPSVTLQISNAGCMILESCSLSPGAGTRLSVGSASAATIITLLNTVIVSPSASTVLSCDGKVQWLNTPSAISGTAPTTLITTSNGMNLRISGVDLSAMGSGKSIVALTSGPQTVLLENCKLGTSVSLTTGNPSAIAMAVFTMVNCSDSSTNYAYQKTDFPGIIYSETVIVRTGGATDGTTAMSRKMVSNANALFPFPLASDVIYIWNGSTSSITVTAHVITDNVTLTDAECWIEVEELGTSGYPLSVIQSDRVAGFFSTPANQTSSSETWTTTGLTTPVKQKLNVTFTPTLKGPLRITIFLAKASTTVYVCPKIEVS